MEFINDMLGLKVSIKDASTYSKISEKDYIQMLKEGYFPILEEDLGEIPEKDDEKYENFRNKKIIPLSYLPEEANAKYLNHYLANDDILDIDFLAYRAKYSRKAEQKLIRELNAIKDLILKTDPKYNEEPLEITKQLLNEYGLTKSRLYDYKKTLSGIPGFTKLLKINEVNYKKNICAYARDLIFERAFRKETPTRNSILQDLQKIKEDNPNICADCPHNKDSFMHDFAKNDVKVIMSSFVLTECTRCKNNGLVIPQSESTITRLINNEGEQAMYLAKTDKNRFIVRYGSKILRDRCMQVNEVVCADHSMLSTLVKVYNRGKGCYELVRPWVTMLVDSCSGAIVGSVISLSPNKYTIMECICRAMAIKPNSPFHGSFAVLYADNGSDYLSDFVTGKRKEVHLNEVLVDNPLLSLIQTKVRHAKRRSPNSKPIERTFGILKKKYLSCIPGYIGNKKGKRAAYLKRKDVMERYIKSGSIWDYEKFVQYWFDYIVPSYNTTPGKDGLSPVERYMNSPRYNGITPSWTTMSYFLSEKQKCKVTTQGIRYNNTLYDCPELKQFISKRNKKWVRVYDFDPPMSDSIILLYNNIETKETRYIGVAYKKVHTQENNTKSLAIKYEMAIQNWQFKQLNDTIAAVRYLSELNKFTTGTYMDYDTYTKTVMASYYSNVVNESAPEAVPIGNSATLEIVIKAQEEQMKHIHNTYEVMKKKENITSMINLLKKYNKSKQQSG